MNIHIYVSATGGVKHNRIAKYFSITSIMPAMSTYVIGGTDGFSTPILGAAGRTGGGARI